MEKYLDSNCSPLERAQDLLSKMDLNEKMRQLGCTMCVPAVPKQYLDLQGGIGAATVMGADNMAVAVRELQDYVMDHSPHRIPALIHGEALAGPVNLVGGNQYPISIGLGATFAPEIVEKMCEYTRAQMLANGIRHALSPVADLARDLRWGRVNETYGNDPTLSAAMTVAFVRGIQGPDMKDGIAACGKHFLGYSQTEGGMNMHKSMFEQKELREQFAKPFEAAVNLAGLRTVMNAYSSINGKPVAASREILTDLLRDQLGFTGTVISDYMSATNVHDPYKMAETYAEAGKMCLEAGLDIEAPARMAYGDELTRMVETGEVDIRYVDTSVLRVLTLKFELGLFENPYPREDMLKAAMDNTECNRGSCEAALKSMTLVKNDGILPLEGKGKKIAVIGPTGNCLRMMYSHYTAVTGMEMMAAIATQGDTQQGFNIAEQLDKAGGDQMPLNLDAISHGEEITDKYALDDMIRGLYPGTRTIFEALKEQFGDVSFAEGCDYKGEDASGMAEAAELAKRSDIVIMCVGGKNGLGLSATTGEGVDAASLDLMGLQEQLMRECYASNPNMVIVHTDGRPLCSEWAYEHVPAILEAWLPNTYGGNAIADVLTGKYNPAGRLPLDVPRSAGHLPVYHYQRNGSAANAGNSLIPTGYIDSSSKVLAPFGSGLSYTTFSYSDMTLTAEADDRLTITVKVRNTGSRDGEEVVQLYGSDLFASYNRPCHELIGFRRIRLAAGEEKTVIFRLNIDVLSFEADDRKWIAEKGSFRFTVGGSSADEAQEQFYVLPRTKEVNPNTRCFYAETAEA